MKYTLFLFINFICISIYAKKVIIRRKVASHQDFSFTLYAPVNEYYNQCLFDNLNEDEYKIGSDSFYYKTAINNPCFYDIFFLTNDTFNGRSTFLMCAGDSIHIKIDIDKQNDMGEVFGGNNFYGNDLFREMNKSPANKFVPIQKLLKASPNNQYKYICSLDGIIDSITGPFRTLKMNNKIYSNYFDSMKKYFRALLYNEVMAKLGSENSFSKQFNKALRDTITESLLKKQPLTDVAVTGLYNSIHYLVTESGFYSTRQANYNYTTYFERNSGTMSVQDSSFVIDKLLAHLINMKDKKVQEALCAFYLGDIFRRVKGYFNEDVMRQYEFIFPSSSYTSLLIDLYKGNANQKSLVYTTPLSIKILDSSSDFKKNINLYFNQSFVFVDVWASWCGPCISEFVYNDQIDSFFLSNNIQKLYISLDQYADKEKWLKANDKSHLGGYHILSAESYKKELELKADDLLPIPRCLFIKKEGKIVVYHGFKPSQTQQLFNELKENVY